MPDNKRYKTSFPLYAAIDPAGCEYQVLGTKVELKLKKGNVYLLPICRLRHSLIISSGWNLMANPEERRGYRGDYSDWKTSDCVNQNMLLVRLE